MISTADISEDGLYRYWLTRTWDPTKPVLNWIMLNPSTADANKDDATIRRCMNFAKHWHYGGIAVYNLFAFRATDPKVLLKTQHKTGLRNFTCLQAITGGDLVLA